jgi:hypothetical protein
VVKPTPLVKPEGEISTVRLSCMRIVASVHARQVGSQLHDAQLVEIRIDTDPFGEVVTALTATV